MKTVLRPLFFLLLLMACKISAQGDGEHTDTVYPEVWDWQPEQYKLETSSSINFYHINNGDVLVNFYWSEEVDGEREGHSEYFTFFGGQTFTSLEEAFITLEGNYTNDTRNQRRIRYSDVHRLPNEKQVELDYVTSFCSRGFDSSVSIYDRNNSEYSVNKTNLLFLPDNPFIYSETRGCDAYDIQFAHDVATFTPDGLAPLGDNTFLVADEDLGIIVRFDENLNSRSDLIGSRLFAADYEDMREFRLQFRIANYPSSVHQRYSILNHSLTLDKIKQMMGQSEWYLDVAQGIEQRDE